MKKLDKLILSSFIGPFIITFLVVVFILLTQHMLKYFDDIIGKGLGVDVIGQLLFYFAIFMTPVAMPLAVLLSSLIAYGNLGEHFELTAVKSAGISLTRTLVPIFFFVMVLTGVAFYVNNTLVPKAALEAYSLLWDIKQKKPALDLREGAFYQGIPDMSIKVNKKFPDGVTIKDVIIYDHRKHDGNRDVTIADSGKMYTIMNERYLKLELFNGYNYTEGASSEQQVSGKNRQGSSETLSRSQFVKTQVVFDLSSFQLERTDPKMFQGNRIMRNISELTVDMDSVDREILKMKYNHYSTQRALFTYYRTSDTITYTDELRQYKASRAKLEAVRDVNQEGSSVRPIAKIAEKADINTPSPPSKAKPDTIRETKKVSPVVAKKPDPKPTKPKQSTVRKKPAPKKTGTIKPQLAKKKPVLSDSARQAKFDSVFAQAASKSILENAANKVRNAKSNISGTTAGIKSSQTERRVFQIQWNKILASSLACIAMFLIGAPLGAIIKKGGLGVPFLVSILFFIIYYLLTMTGEKWAKQGVIPVPVGVWTADVILFVIGLLFLRQARLDARFFEADFYLVQIDRFKRWLTQKLLKHQGVA
jgi:lipopolysaccharide export system permease protein